MFLHLFIVVWDFFLQFLRSNISFPEVFFSTFIIPLEVGVYNSSELILSVVVRVVFVYVVHFSSTFQS